MSNPDESLDRLAGAAEKIAAALEGFREDNEIQVEFGPPVCPHCGTFNPRVTTHESVSEGELADFIIDADCMECGKRMYGVVESYSMHASMETAVEELKSEGRGGQQNGNNDRS